MGSLLLVLIYSSYMPTKFKSAGGVMSAIKSRGDVGSAKKGVSLLGIVQKLSAKRSAAQEEAGESATKESKKAEGAE
jgi:hypothetical protein